MEGGAIARVVGPRIAGIEIIHEADDIPLAPSASEFLGDVLTVEAPLRVTHRAAAVDMSVFTLALDASPATQYFLDDRGEVAATLRPAESSVSEVLRTVTPGSHYEILYDPAPSVPVERALHERTIFSIALLARGRGFLAHACGFILHDGAGVLCPGMSGVGKSTLARLLRDCAEATVLSDDRVAVTLEGDKAHMWGTPWFSKARVAATGEAPLWAIGLLGRGSEPNVRPATSARALEQVFAAAALPWWSSPAMDQSLSLLDSLLGSARIFHLEYPPTAEAAARVMRELLERRKHG